MIIFGRAYLEFLMLQNKTEFISENICLVEIHSQLKFYMIF